MSLNRGQNSLNMSILEIMSAGNAQKCDFGGLFCAEKEETEKTSVNFLH